ATLIGFAFLAGCTGAVAQRVFPIRYEWQRLAALLALTIGLWLVSRLLPTAWWVWPVKGGLWLLAPVLVWYTGLMSRGEKEQVRALTRAVTRMSSLRYSSRRRGTKETLVAGGDGRENQLSRRHC
ncbi:MAG: hypothetical protein ACRELG_27885, partial [Gemmataceae bacterium]